MAAPLTLTFFEDKPNPYCHGQLSTNFALFKRQNPFGTLPGYQTNLGVVDVPTTPVGGYVFSPGSGWVLYATTSSAGRGEAERGRQPYSSASGG